MRAQQARLATLLAKQVLRQRADLERRRAALRRTTR
jgi:hypothetical protein